MDRKYYNENNVINGVKVFIIMFWVLFCDENRKKGQTRNITSFSLSAINGP